MKLGPSSLKLLFLLDVNKHKNVNIDSDKPLIFNTLLQFYINRDYSWLILVFFVLFVFSKVSFLRPILVFWVVLVALVILRWQFLSWSEYICREDLEILWQLLHPLDK